jgi:hypothetical protein
MSACLLRTPCRKEQSCRGARRSEEPKIIACATGQSVSASTLPGDVLLAKVGRSLRLGARKAADALPAKSRSFAALKITNAKGVVGLLSRDRRRGFAAAC